MIHRPLCAGLLALAVLAPAHAADVDVGVSISVGQPGFYGRIDIGNVPPPVVVYPQPVIIQQAPVAVVRQPIYLHVPPGHQKNWAKHCYRYAACNQPVYFVQDRWYQEVYVPQYRQRYAPPPPPPQRKYKHDDDRGPGKGHGRGQGNGKGRDRD
ncbi:MAG: hypothetical protein QM722_20700 [Piscinibacter sp.]